MQLTCLEEDKKKTQHFSHKSYAYLSLYVRKDAQEQNLASWDRALESEV